MRSASAEATHRAVLDLATRLRVPKSADAGQTGGDRKGVGDPSTLRERAL